MSSVCSIQVISVIVITGRAISISARSGGSSRDLVSTKEPKRVTLLIVFRSNILVSLQSSSISMCCHQASCFTITIMGRNVKMRQY